MRYIFIFLLAAAVSPGLTAQEFYELRKYSITGEEQEKRLDDYLKNAYIPAAKKAGISAVGVFKPIVSDKDHYGKLVFVLTPFSNLSQFEKLPFALARDKQYLAKGKDYLDAAYDNPPYQRIEGTLMRAFTGFPKHRKPRLSTPHTDRVYELRSYEAATEQIHLNKVAMFNEGGEIEIFNRLGFNAVFYGEVLAGKEQPNLVYMTTFANTESRDQHWETFREDAGWLTLKDDPRYQNNVSARWAYLLYPADYSDL